MAACKKKQDLRKGLRQGKTARIKSFPVLASHSWDEMGDGTMGDTKEKVCKSCWTSTEDCVNSRRCFMTGEYCSKQTNIQKERKRLHENGCINAFVIMNFSNMSDVVYKWRLRSFIESLEKFLYFDDKRLYCLPRVTEEKKEKIKEGVWKPVKIKVIRADSDPASNYVICNRVCQQMQIADLVIVDVSIENVNVFYEFGMAVALGKLILPICYSESFYEMKIPDEVAKKMKEGDRELEHHMDCYPWRKRLFEYYGIRYRSEEDCKMLDGEKGDKKTGSDKKKDLPVTRYLKFKKAASKIYEFSDIQYDRFPYHEIIKMGNSEIQAGRKIYNRLKDSYNNSRYEHNTLVVYTMDGFLNETQAGQCMINFYINFTKQMKEEHCFCGDRVGILIQSNSILEDVKDAKEKRNLLYSVGEIIHIGMNQAAYAAQKEMIKAKDFLSAAYEDGAADGDWEKDMKIFVKDHIRNKSMSIYPNNPVYVNRVKSGLQKDILEKTGKGDFSFEHYFCLYHVMLRTLKYTNEIVVDISKNSLQSLFWLGAAHGSDVYAITVVHEESDKERIVKTGSAEKKERDIFDVAGLWTAVLRSHDTEGFYRQLALAQLGIEQHTKLMLKNVESFEEELQEYVYETEGIKNINHILDAKEKEEARVLESYYRDRFWRHMLRYNRLCIYLPQVDDTDSEDGEPRLHTVKWDVDAIAELSQYLSKRKIIGEYNFKTLRKGQADEKAKSRNFICVGNAAKPLEKSTEKDEKPDTQSLAEYIGTRIGKTEGSKPEPKTGYNVIHKRNESEVSFLCDGKENPDKKRIYKGFVCIDSRLKENIFTQTPQAACYGCRNAVKENAPANPAMLYINESEENFKNKCCELRTEKDSRHIQLAQLVLWREVPGDVNERVYFRVSLTGVSGPATLALSAILVDDDQKKKIFNMKERDRESLEPFAGRNLLSGLQEQIRRKFEKIYFMQLDKQLKGISDEFWARKEKDDKKDDGRQREICLKQVKYAVELYLSTVLYRYFLPFLSLEDEYHICNGMQTYISAMLSASINPFALARQSDEKYVSEKFVQSTEKNVTETLKKVLRSFRGAEALYEVEVSIGNREEAENTGKGNGGKSNKKLMFDTRKVFGIKELKVDGKPPVNCLFCED